MIVCARAHASALTCCRASCVSPSPFSGKIIEAAVLYDRYHPSAVQLDAFEGSSMGPHIFKARDRRACDSSLA